MYYIIVLMYGGLKGLLRSCGVMIPDQSVYKYLVTYGYFLYFRLSGDDLCKNDDRRLRTPSTLAVYSLVEGCPSSVKEILNLADQFCCHALYNWSVTCPDTDSVFG